MIDSDPHSILQSFPPLLVVCRETTPQRPLLLLAKGNCQDLSKSPMLIKFCQEEGHEKIKKIDKEEEKRGETRGLPGRVYVIGWAWVTCPCLTPKRDGKMSVIVNCFLPSRVIKWALPKIERGLRWWIAKSWTNVHRTTIQSSCNHLWGVYVCQHEPGIEDKRWAGKTWNLPLCWRMTKNKQIF